jgi:hypothetical protein
MTKPIWQQKLNCTAEEAKTFIGKHILVGVGHADGTREQFHGIIDRISSEEGIVVKLNGSDKERTLPPDVSKLQMARPGQYTLKGSSEVVNDPDFLAKWEMVS